MDFADRMVNRLFRLRRVWGIHIWESLAGECHIHALLIENNKETLFIKEHLELQEISQLSDDMFSNIPICLSYDSPKVLLKEINGDLGESVGDLLHINNIDEFEVQAGALANGYLASVIRKEHFNDLITSIENENLNLISFTLGAINFNSCLSFFDNKEESSIFEFCNYRIIADNDAITKIERSNKWSGSNDSIKIGNESISGEFILPYCNALSVLLYGEEIPYLGLTPFKSKVAGSAYDKLYKRIWPVCLGLLFSILLGNFFLLQHYNSKQRQVSVEYAGFQLAHKKLEKLKQQFDDHKNLIGQLDSESYGFFSFYADRIAASIKGRVLLTDLNIYPCHEKNDKMEKIFVFEKNRIMVQGTCNSPMALSKWIKDLMKETFILNITHQEYMYDEIKKTGRFSFQLKVLKL